MTRAAPAQRPGRRRRGVVAGVTAVITVLAALGACGLPTDGPVEAGLEVGGAPMPPVRVQVAGPRDGADADEIVRSFLAASWSPQDDYRAARAYLTPEASAAWNPRAGVTVYPASPQLTVERLGEGRMRLRATEIGHLGPDGRYASRPLDSTRTSVVELTRTSGQWRVSKLDSDFGVWLSRSFFESAYRPFDIAYPAAYGRTLVSDRRWFLVGSTLPTVLTQALLEPVPEYLRGAVESGFPSGSRLALDAVPVIDGSAQIDLDPAVLGGSATARRAAWAQALATVRQAPGVTAVSLQAAGSELDIVGESEAPTSPEALGYTAAGPDAPYVVGRSGSTLSVVDRDGVGDPAPGKRTPARLPDVQPGWSRLAVSSDAVQVAAVGGDGLDLKRWRGSEAVQVPRFATGLTPPAFDRHDVLWVAGVVAGRSGVFAFPPTSGLTSTHVRVSTPWLGRGQLLEVRPSPGGQRAIVLARSPSGRLRVGISGVVRDGNGVPTSLTTPLAVAGDVQEATRAAWVDADTVVLLGRRDATGPVRPILVDIGGATTVLSALPDPRSVVSTGGERGLLVASGDGSVYARAGAGWQAIARMDDVLVPGH